jgi:hypothetical protein
MTSREQVMGVLTETALEDLEERCDAIRDTTLDPDARRSYIAEDSAEIMTLLVQRHAQELTR